MKYVHAFLVLLVLNMMGVVQAQNVLKDQLVQRTTEIQNNELKASYNHQDAHLPEAVEKDFHQNKRPNILVVYVDDLDHLTFGHKGHPFIETPNIDRLASEGVEFTNAFVTTATCITSRGSFMTGQYAARTGIYFDQFDGLSSEQVDMIYPSILQKAGYHTGYVGKWHLGSVPKGVFDQDQRLDGQGRFWDEEEWPGEGTHLTDRLGNQAVDMIQTAPADQPFAITVGFKAPHVQDGFHPVEPYPASPSTAVLYELDEVPAPPLSDDLFFENQPKLIQESLGRVRWNYRLGTPESLNFQRSIRRYYRMVTGVDQQLGKMMEALRETDRLENTIIVFTSDHGMYLGERGLAGKWFGHDTSIRVPLIIVDPRMAESEKGSKREAMVLNIDFHPTILEWAGLSAGEHVQGQSYVSILQGTTPADWRNEFFYEHHSFADRIPRSEGIRTKQYKYLNFLDSSPTYEELYDLENDPHEEYNLALDQDYGSLLKEMRQKWRRWQVNVQ